MSMKPVIPCAVLLTMLAARAAQAQEYPTPVRAPDAPERVPDADLAGPPTPQPYPPDTGPSKWILYSQPCCCGPVGGDGPIFMELYVRTGPTLIVSRPGWLADSADNGWLIQGGGRSLFFNVERDRAFTIDLGLGYVGNHGGKPDLFTTVVHENPFGFSRVDDVSLATLHRTYVHFGVGQQWWLVGASGCGSSSWRVGADVGGRYGAARIDLHDYAVFPGQYIRRGDTFWGANVALHTDIELPMKCCTCFGGFRAEWGYDWMNFDTTGNDHVAEVNLLLNLGVRF